MLKCNIIRLFETIIPIQAFRILVSSGNSGSRAWQLSIFCLLAAVAMEDVTRLVSSGDCLKIWDSTSMTVLEQFSPHSATHPVAQVCWSSSSILYHCHSKSFPQAFWASFTHSNPSRHWSCVFGAYIYEEIFPRTTMFTKAKCEISLTLEKSVEKLCKNVIIIVNYIKIIKLYEYNYI